MLRDLKLKKEALKFLPFCIDDVNFRGFRGLNVPEDDIEYEFSTVISIDSLLVYEKKYYLQVFFANCA